MLQLKSSDPLSVEKTAEILKQGGVAIIPTETVYGLAACWKNSTARQQIYELKKRPADKRLQMLAPSMDAAVAAGLADDSRLRRLEKRFWPGALTAVAATADGDSIGLRIPAHPFVLALLKKLDEPLACTSANLSGEPAAISPVDAVAHLAGNPDVLVDGGIVTATGGQSSTVVSILGEVPVILRPGPISLDEILDVLK